MAVHTVSVEIGGRDITFETGLMAKQAHGAVVVRQGDSAVLVTAVGDTKPTRFDFLPLTCDYQDRTGAYGRIPGGFLKREGRANERETITSRLIDRPIRPQFPKHYRSEVQVIATVLSYDPDNDTDMLAICGAGAALHISDLPLKAPIAAVRIAQIDGAFVLNPTRAAMMDATCTLIVAGTNEAVCMVEGGGVDASEEVVLDAIYTAHDEIKKIIGAVNQLRELAGVEKREVAPAPQPDADIAGQVEEHGLAGLQAGLGTSGKHERKSALKAARSSAFEKLTDGVEDEEKLAYIEGQAKDAWNGLIRREMRGQVIAKGIRVDGRATDEIRDIACQVGLATRAHGSALFTRGETQAFVTAALGVDGDDQRIDTAGAQVSFSRWMLTYGFPPFCTGETRRLMGPKRREIGHGVLAHRAIQPMLPANEDFPYVLRCTSEVLESNGSSSMATVCGATLSLMDAGVPLKAPVAGIAMGLVVEGDDFAVLSDILGDEDHLGDMDFKVTGTESGITAFQMDVKISGVTREIMTKALSQAREGRLHILGEMAKTIAAPREEVSPWAPRITSIQVKQDKIRDIIGPGGRTIRSIQDQTGARVNVDDTGRVDISSSDADAAAAAVGMIRELTQEAEIGKLYLGVVKRCTDFGAFVEIFPGTDGLVHISHLAQERVDQVTDVVNEGDEVLVRVIDVDRQGKVRLSRKEALDASAL